MKSLFKIGLLASLAAALLMACGCSDDDPVSPVGKQVGNLNNPELTQVMGNVAISELYADQLLDDIFDVLEGVFDSAAQASPGNRARPGVVSGIDADSISLTYSATSQYWHRYVRIEEPADTLTINDSIQFLHAIGPVQWPDSTLLTGLHAGAQMNMLIGYDTTIEAAQELTIMGDIVGRGDITLNGTQAVYRGIINDTCSVIVELARTATDIVMNIAASVEPGCPDSGVLSSAASISMECVTPATLSYDNSWTIVETFTGDNTRSVVVEDATTRWVFTDSCNVE